jgi:hypothetical protein
MGAAAMKIQPAPEWAKRDATVLFLKNRGRIRKQPPLGGAFSYSLNSQILSTTCKNVVERYRKCLVVE